MARDLLILMMMMMCSEFGWNACPHVYDEDRNFQGHNQQISLCLAANGHPRIDSGIVSGKLIQHRNPPLILSCVASPLRFHSFPGRRIRRILPVSALKYDGEFLGKEPNGTSEEWELPTMSDILSVAMDQNVKLHLKSFGPFFTVKAESLLTNEEIGRAAGFITIWFGGKILHLESIRMTQQAFRMQKSIFGVGLLLGAVAIRYGYDCNCRKAELLAINDSELYHSKLVRFYTRMGFKAVYEVTGSSLIDLVPLLTWGGKGTRMDADIRMLLTKWSGKFRLRSPVN